MSAAQMVFYKFRSHRSSEDLARTLAIIREGRIYAPKLRELNDPAEGWFLFCGNSPEEAEVRALLRDQVRVVSVCRFYSNALLWSYYADSFSGVCLALSFPEDQPQQVIYHAMRETVFADHQHHGAETAAIKHARRKRDYWKHEIEFRVIRTAATAERAFIPCRAHGVLFGMNTPKNIRNAISAMGRARDPNFHTAEVRLDPRLSQPCLGAGLGVRPPDVNQRWWLNDGAGPISPSRDRCVQCGVGETGNAGTGYFLEEHVTCNLSKPLAWQENDTVTLCPSCHRKEHLTTTWANGD